MTYIIYFMRGDSRKIEADSVASAYSICIEHYSETRSWDILKITDIYGNEV